jgi:hypothetical protein
VSDWARVRFLVATAVVGALLAGIWLVPSVASADNPAKKKPKPTAASTTYSDSDCQALKQLDDEIPEVKSSSSDIFGKRAAAISKGFSETADKIDDNQLKSALESISRFYGDLSKADNVVSALKVTAKSAKSYAQASATWLKATTSCVVSSVTIPSITLPSGVTLPNGVTIPNITLPTIPR